MMQYFRLLMDDKRNTPADGPVKAVLYAVSLIYGLAIWVRALLYRHEIFVTSRVPLTVISVGNLTLGGTGKTPFVILLARVLKDELKKETSVLIRGYGWDEQALLRESMPDIPILVSEDRVKAAKRSIKLYGSEAAILDDGFQYWELGRDLDIVLVDSREVFGNGNLFPRGVLREPKSAIARADIVVFTKTDRKKTDLAVLKDVLRGYNPDLLFLEAAHRPKYFFDPKAKRDVSLAGVKGKRVILLSSIGDPSYFEDTVLGLGAEVADHFIFPDHHDYTIKDIARIKRRLGEKKFDYVITTGKDAVKFHRMRFDLMPHLTLVLVISMEITFGKELLIDRLHRIYNRQGA